VQASEYPRNMKFTHSELLEHQKGYVYSMSIAGQTSEFTKYAYVAMQYRENISNLDLKCFVSNTYNMHDKYV